MIALAVDDERLMLQALTTAIKVSPDITFLESFMSCREALEWTEENRVDIAFLDINMRGMGGLALAEKLLERQQDCKIIFCTGYPEHALEALRIHVSGYLIKPITSEAVQKEIDHIKRGKMSGKKLQVRCFGHFEVYVNNTPLSFKRSKTKEVFAFLVDRKGAGVTTKEICAKLWEESGNDIKKMNYLYKIMSDLSSVLETAGAGNVLIRTGRTYAVDTEQIDCDYYSYLERGKPAFKGEYMRQFSWSEETVGLLWKYK